MKREGQLKEKMFRYANLGIDPKYEVDILRAYLKSKGVVIPEEDLAGLVTNFTGENYCLYKIKRIISSIEKTIERELSTNGHKKGMPVFNITYDESKKPQIKIQKNKDN